MEEIEKIVNINKLNFKQKNISFISQNCIGGVIYHDMEQKFLSPTINLYFSAKDFIKFVTKIDYYLNIDLKIIAENPITGILDDVKLYFLHYNSKDETITKWKERKVRINKEKMFIICTDRDGFDDECFAKFKNVKYHKALITCNKKWKDYDFTIYLEQYSNLECVPDTIPKREFYNNTELIELINKI